MLSSAQGMNSRMYMELSILSLLECDPTGLMVGAVIEKNGQVLGVGFKTAEAHAERTAIESALSAGYDLSGSTLFTTHEPSARLSNLRKASFNVTH